MGRNAIGPHRKSNPSPIPRCVLTGTFLVLLAGQAHAVVVNSYLTQGSFNSAATTSVLETFETFAPKDTALSSFVRSGVTYTGNAGTPFPNVWVSSPGYNNFGAGVGTTTSSILTANGDEDFTLTFSTLYTAIGFDVYFNGLGPVTVTLNTLGGSSIFTDVRNLNSIGYYGFVSSAPIQSLRFASTLGGRLNTGIDNISVGAASVVPEPTTLALFGVGLLGFAAVRRRRGAKA